MENVVSICIPTYQRFEVLFESFHDVYDDPRVGEIVIVDDDSDLELFEKIREKSFAFPKIKLYRNIRNRDCYENKYTAISHANNPYCILLDSDNRINKGYLDKIFAYAWYEDVIMTPSFASPNFDFRAFEDFRISKENVSMFMNKPMFETMLNAANYFVNRDMYLKTWDNSVDPVTSDSIYICLKWLEAGRKIFVVPGLTYMHRVWHESHYQKNVSRTPPGFHQSILDRLKRLPEIKTES